MSIHHWHAAQWIVAVWLVFGISSVFYPSTKTAAKIGNGLATLIWIALLWWGGFWS
jgi:hypothetical protein